jgi:hypothetical protein
MMDKCFQCGKELECGKGILNTYLCRMFCSYECEAEYIKERKIEEEEEVKAMQTELAKYKELGTVEFINLQQRRCEETKLMFKDLHRDIYKLQQQLENSVKLPCKVGDTIYAICRGKKDIFEIKVEYYNGMIIRKKEIKDYYIHGKNQYGATEMLGKSLYKSKKSFISWYKTKPEAETRLAKEAENDK